jgi:mersacidin/lichenicidin family type 2 lantibiotic
MSRIDVVRAWKDPSYRHGLTAEEIARVPSHPAGLVDLSDEELKEASGLASYAVTTSPGCTLSETYRRSRCCP